MAKANWFDKTISFFSPKAGVRRAQYRRAQQIYSERAYEGSSHGPRTSGWTTPSNGSANTELWTSLFTLRNRARDLVRNNPFASRGIRVITSNTIGDGIIPQIRAKNKSVASNIAALWEAWAETTACDADGIHNIYGLQNLAMRCVAESGEVIIRKRSRRPTDNLPIPLQLQVLEPDFLDSSRSQILDNGNYIIQGVEFNALGQRVAYYIFSEHPGGWVTGRFTIQSNRIDASEIRHVYRADRPGQIRGCPWLAPVIVRLRDFDEYEDAQLMRQKVAACFTGVITDTDSSSDSLAGKPPPISDRVTPGMFEVLPPGKSITFGNPPSVDGYESFSKVTLHAIAAGLDVTYEALTSDLSGVNFSSGRMGWLEFNRNVSQWRWQIIIPQFCDPIFQWFLEAATLSGNKTDGVTASWTPPIRDMIDPSKEISASNLAIRSGQTTLKETIRERGYDPLKIFAERAEEIKELKALGIVTDSNPAEINLSGMEQPSISNGQGDQ